MRRTKPISMKMMAKMLLAIGALLTASEGTFAIASPLGNCLTVIDAKVNEDVVSTVAIQRTIDACAQGGGGWVVVPRGVYRTGALFFRPGVKLRLDEGAVLLGSDDGADYPLCETRIEGETCRYYPAMINADRCDDADRQVYGNPAGAHWPHDG